MAMSIRGWKYPSVPTFTYTPPPHTQTSAATRIGPDGHWKCCYCTHEHAVYVQSGPHPLGLLKCICTHTPCETCALSGSVKYFMPISEPATVLLPSGPHPGQRVDMEIPYGVVCEGCGLSWRAREVDDLEKEKEKEGKGKGKTSGVKKMPSLSIRGLKQHRRLEPKEGKLRKSKSLYDLVLPSARKPASDKKKKDVIPSQEKKKERNKKKREDVLPSPGQGQGQTENVESGGVQTATVQFSGIKCKCGRYSSIDDFCFRVTERNTAATRATTAQYMSIGHDGPIITVRGVGHPNPLRSCPVEG